MRTMLAMAAAAVMMASQAAAQDVHKTDEPGIKYPVLTREVKPNYTEDAMRRKVQGIVEMEVVVKSDGTVGDVTVTRSLDPDLDQEAIKAMRQWGFKPGTKDGEPVAVLVNVEMTFTLRSKK